ncbi:class E sortase [Amycolatopsis sp. cmx-11-12]|uniref:class E sortase n=1 Tax=Amycolatopsis sp. cmx-11-12 TaxID=2785795 RepID=UPI003917D78B
MTVNDAAPKHRTSRRTGQRQPPTLWMSEILLIAGLTVLLFACYELWGKTGELNKAQDQLNNQLVREWQQPSPAGPAPHRQNVTPGTPIARLELPRLGLRWTVTEGVDKATLKQGPGHYPGTQRPGETGNFAVAGHRTPGVFWDLEDMRPGDVITVEDRTSRYVYRVTHSEVVSPDDGDALAPVPDRPGAKPTVASLVLTTCNPKWDNYQRLVVESTLESKTPK